MPERSGRFSTVALLSLGTVFSANAFEAGPIPVYVRPLRGEQCQSARAESEEGNVRRVLDEQVEAWNRGDLEGYMAGYWSSPDLVFQSGGTLTRGWQPTLDRYRRRYQEGGREMGRLRFHDVAVEMLGAGVALARGGWSLEVKGDKRPRGLFTVVFRVIPGAGWRIVHDHSSSSE